ncbi:hypothetical protein F4782DRAFT_544365 [Xylaria castorea]|nr:hypothetical protein F4782DRAFT_544365 [Xylaria castorea]
MDFNSADSGPASVCSYTPPEISRKVIDPDGDLSLMVGETKCVYRSRSDVRNDEDPDHEHELPVIYVVCSRALSRASPVWKKLLYGGFAESKPSCALSAEDWVVELPDDDPKAVETILNIIHSRFDSLPRTTNLTSLEDLYQLTVLTDKYDLTALLRPWATSWINSARDKCDSWDRSDTKLVTSDLERLSWIAWELGDPILFGTASRALAQSCSVDAGGDLQNNTENEIVPLFNTTIEPPGLYDALKAARLRFIDTMLAIYYNALAAFTQSGMNYDLARVCEGAIQHHKRKACDAATLGTMILSLASSGYWPLPVTSNIRTDVTKLAVDLADIEILSPVHPHYFTSSSSVKARMAKQAAKLGID